MMSGYPSGGQIALALIVLRTLPIRCSVEEYIGRIRKAIVNRQRRTPIHTQQYIDGTRFWKEAFEQIEVDTDKLRNRISELEQAREKNEDKELKTLTHTNLRSDTKSTAKANTQSKRLRIEPEVGEQFKVNIEDAFSRLTLGHHSLLRALHLVGAHLKGKTACADTMCQSINAASLTASQLLRTTCSSATNQLGVPEDIDGIETTFRAVVKVWKILLVAIQKIDVRSKAYRGSVPSMVLLFQNSLGQIHQFCLDEADRQIKPKKRHSKTRTNASLAKFQVDMKARESDKACSIIANASCQMLAALDLTSEAHFTIYEGMMCTLLDHVGSSISLLIFAEEGTPIDKQLGVLPPAGLTDVVHIDSNSALLTSQLAGPYLVLILKKATVVSETLSNKHRSMLSRSGASSADVKVDLTDIFACRLQNTLLRGVYGDEDTAFENVLDRCEGPGDTDMEQLFEQFEKEKDRSEWFIGQVWEHIGWDVLMAD